KMTGIVAEKNNTAETDTTAITNLVISGALVTNKEGKNISAISIDAALAASNGSGTCVNHVNGKNTYPKISKVTVNSANTNPNKPTDKIVGNVAAAINTPSLKFIHIFFQKLGVVSMAIIARSHADFRRFSVTDSSGWD